MRSRSIAVSVLLVLAVVALVRAQVTTIQLTTTGNASRPAVSPDGKFVAYVQNPNSVWVRDLAASRDVQIVASTPGVSISAFVAVTPDSRFVDFIRSENRTNSLWRVPILGGEARQLVDEASGAPGWSPDGTQMAFLRLTAQGQSSLVVADAEGGKLRVVATRTRPQRSYGTFGGPPPLWLPGGRAIVVVTGSNELVTVNVETGAETVQTTRGGGAVNGVASAADGRSFLVSIAIGGTVQLMSLRSLDGEGVRLTNDVFTYRGVSLAGDTLVTTKESQRNEMWVADGDGNDARRINDDLQVFTGLAWAGGGRLVYGASTLRGLTSPALFASDVGIWSDDLAGARRVVAPGAFNPSASADGRTIVFSRGGGIWHADADGRNPSQISATVTSAVVTPDGSAVVYVSNGSLWIVDFRGLTPRQLVAQATGSPQISPDGRLVALGSVNEQRQREILLVSIDGSQPVRRLARPLVPSVRWTPDGAALAYLGTGAPSNIWVQPIDGGEARQLTDFTDASRIVSFAWSPDGKRLALWRMQDVTDVVMFKGIP